MTDAMIESGTGNLLQAPVDALVNTVNCVGIMGKGIALQFKRAWPQMYAAYHAAAERGEIRIGQMHVYETGNLVGPRLIINFPTKRHWRGSSQLADIEAGLADLVRVLRVHDVRSVAIPPLGAGLGGLDWQQVRPLIVAAMAPLTDVQVLLWEPGAAPPAAEHSVNSGRPGMTAPRAMLLALMDRYRLLDHAVTHLEAQKLGYFLERAGAPGDFQFAPNAYGPYSDRLYHMLDRMEGHQIRGLQDRSPQASLALEPAGVAEAEAFLGTDPTASEWFERVSTLIHGFQTPYGMELLATIDWLARAHPEAADDPDACHRALGQWPVNAERKTRIMRPEHLRVAWERLVDQGWIGGPSATPPSAEASGSGRRDT